VHNYSITSGRCSRFLSAKFNSLSEVFTSYDKIFSYQAPKHLRSKMETQNKQLLGVIPANEADILQSKLSRAGVEIVTIFNHSSCKTGCSPSKEIWAHPLDVKFIQEHIQELHFKSLVEMGADIGQINQVFDTSKETALCPACGFEFSTTLTVCPECELVFA
jgi:hypothetical protein